MTIGIKDWAKTQFTRDRMIRYLDGANESSCGATSFVQLITGVFTYPYLFSVCHIRKPDGRRGVYYLKVSFYGSKKLDYSAELEMWTNGNSKKHKFVIHFSDKENAPKKLNKAIRALRNEMGI